MVRANKRNEALRIESALLNKIAMLGTEKTAEAVGVDKSQISRWKRDWIPKFSMLLAVLEWGVVDDDMVNRPGFPGECFICELRLPDHRFRWKHNKLFLLLPEEYGPAFPAIVDCYTSPPTLVWPVPLLHGFSSSYGVLPPLCKDH